MDRNEEKSIRVGVSACLAGQEVRYDGGHRLHPFVHDVLGARFELVPVCPESEIGMGTPRETIQLVGDPQRPDLIATETGRVWTGEMSEWVRARVRALAGEELCGFVFKRNSPSCGMRGVPVVLPSGEAPGVGRGFFAAEILRSNPLLPVAEEHRLDEAAHRETFLEQVYARRRLDRATAAGWTADSIGAFQQSERRLLGAHDPKRAAKLDDLVRTAADFRPSAFVEQYRALFMETIRRPATVAGHLDAMREIAGHLHGLLDAAEQRELIERIEGFAVGRGNPGAAIDCLAGHVRRHGVEELGDQSYLRPIWFEA